MTATAMTCDMCGLDYTEPSMGGDGVCPWCDQGITRDGRRWSYREAIAAGDARLRRVVARDREAALLPWADERGVVHAVEWIGGPYSPSVLTVCGRRNSGCRIALRFKADDPRACDFCLTALRQEIRP